MPGPAQIAGLLLALVLLSTAGGLEEPVLQAHRLEVQQLQSKLLPEHYRQKLPEEAGAQQQRQHPENLLDLTCLPGCEQHGNCNLETGQCE